MNPTDVADQLRARDLLALVDDVCKRRGVTLDEVWWRLRHHPQRDYSYPEIARLFARNHTTIMAGICAHERRASVTLP